MRVPIPLVGPSYQSRELPLSAQRTKNLYPSLDPEAKAVASLHTFPGLSAFATTSGSDRGMYVANGVLYKVSGTTLYSINSSGTATNLGTIAGSGRCDFAHDDTYLIITTVGSVAYLNSFFIYSGVGVTAYQLTISSGTLALISDADLTLTNGQFVTSQVSDPDNISALDYATAESHPDSILRTKVYSQLVYFFGDDTIEPWYNSGTGNPPFDRVQGAVKPYGLAGQWAVDVMDDDLFFLDNTRSPIRMRGLEVASIGNNALGKEWATYFDVSDCIVMAFTMEHQTFVVFTFPTANRSWCYHEPSSSWLQLSYGVDDDRHRGTSYAFCYGKHLMADHTNGKVYELDFDTFTDNSAVIQRQRTTASIHGGLYQQAGAEIEFHQVEFVCQVGEGINTGQGSDPQLMVRYSDDGGKTYSAQEYYPLGAGGDYLRRVVLYDQGRAQQRIYELTYSEPTPFALFSAHADVDFTLGIG